jgi:hypothetical protein
MTNIIWAITLVTITNWTGHMVGTNELGYIATNHSLTVNYHGTDHKFTLLSEPGNVAVWRPQESMLYATNFYVTNLYSPWVIPMPGYWRLEGGGVVMTNRSNPRPWTTNEAVIPVIRELNRTQAFNNAKGQTK